MSNKHSHRTIGLLSAIVLVLAIFAVPIAAQSESGGWCAGKRIRFFVGGAEGDAFASIVLRGAQAAEADLGPTVEYVFSGWNTDRMIQQLREAIASQPDGIAMMGHPGDAAIMPLAEEAAAAGIAMMYQNVDVPEVRARFGGGYVGAQLYEQGYALGEELIRLFNFGEGDAAVVYSGWTQPGRFIREQATVDALEAVGVTVIKVNALPEWATDPNQATPVIAPIVADTPNLRLIVHPGGQHLGAVPIMMETFGKGPGEIINAGFDTSPAVIEAFESGYVQLTADQQPFLQGYIPILSLCGTLVYGLGPLNVDTGAGFVTPDNYQIVGELARQGFR